MGKRESKRTSSSEKDQRSDLLKFADRLYIKRLDTKPTENYRMTREEFIRALEKACRSKKAPDQHAQGT